MKKLIFACALVLISTPVFGASRIVNPVFSAEDSVGAPLSGGCLYSYECNTSTKKALCTDKPCSANHPNPLALDARGEKEIFTTECVDLVLTTAASPCPATPSGTIWSSDDVYGINRTTGVSLNNIYACDLAVAITEIGSTVTTLEVDCAETIADGVTIVIPTTMTLDILSTGHIFDTAGGGTETLTTNGEVRVNLGLQAFSPGLVVNGPGLARGVSPELWGAVGDGITDDNAAVQAFFTYLAANNAIGHLAPEASYLVNTTINPDVDGYTLHWNGARLKFNAIGTYTAIEDRDGTDSGLDVAFNIQNSHDFNWIGKAVLDSTGNYPSTLPSNLVALTASARDSGTGNAPGSNFSADEIQIIRFDYGIYLGDNDPALGGSGINPFVRAEIGTLDIQSVNYGIYLDSEGRNAFDDSWIGILRIAKFTTEGIRLDETELTVGSLFMAGKTSAYAEAEVGSGTAATATLTLSAAGSWANNDVIVITGGATRGTGATPLVTTVSSGGGTTTLTLADNLEENVTSAVLYRNPPTGITLDNAKLNAGHVFLEQIFHRGIDLHDRADFATNDLKISAGVFSALKEAAVEFRGAHGKVIINMSETNIAGGMEINTGVYIDMVNDGTDDAQRLIRVSMGEGLTDADYAPLLYGAPTDLLTGYSDISASTTDDTAIVEAANGVYIYPSELGAARLKAISGRGAIEGNVHRNSRGQLVALSASPTTIVDATDLKTYSQFEVRAQDSAANINIVADGNVTGAGVLTLTNQVSVGGTFTVGAGGDLNDIQITNTSGANRTVRWSIIYLNNAI